MKPPEPLVAVLEVVIGLIVIVIAVRFLMRIIARSRLFEIPAAADVELAFEASGPVVLHLEGPNRFRHRPALQLTLFDVMAGSAVPMKRTLPSRIAGRGLARFSMTRFEIRHAGRFRLSAQGLDKLGELSPWRYVLARPTGLALPLAILAIVAGSLMLVFGVLSIVLPVATP